MGGGGGGRGGHGGPMSPHSFGTEQALNAEVYRALSARSYSDTAHISIMNHCLMSCKHKALKSAAPKRQFCGSASGRGFEKRPYNESPELQSSRHKFCVVMVVSDGLRSTLI